MSTLETEVVDVSAVSMDKLWFSDMPLTTRTYKPVFYHDPEHKHESPAL